MDAGGGKKNTESVVVGRFDGAAHVGASIASPLGDSRGLPRAERAAPGHLGSAESQLSRARGPGPVFFVFASVPVASDKRCLTSESQRCPTRLILHQRDRKCM